MRLHRELPNQRQKLSENLWVAGTDVPGFKPFFAAREVGDQAARFENNETAGGDIPGLEAEFPEAVVAAAGYPAEVKRRRARTSATFLKPLR